MNKAARAAAGCLSAPAAAKRARRAAGCRHYESEIRVRRGHCRAPGCASRAGVVRVTLDTTDQRRIERFAHVECAQCGRVWYRVSNDTEATRGGYLAALVTLIVPSDERRVIYRVRKGGAAHVAGDDTVILTNVTFGQLDDAARAWRKRNAAVLARLDRARASRAAKSAAATAALSARIADWHERHEIEAAAERLAEARERGAAMVAARLAGGAA